MNLEYRVVDVFTSVALEGNPLAVFTDPQQLDGAIMQRIARELNLSETAFILPPERAGAAARVRIFTPGFEMRFAGHPTIGCAYVAVEMGLVPPGATGFILEEGIGPVPIEIERTAEGRTFWLQTPPIESGPSYERAACARACGLEESDLLADVPCTLLSAGNPVIFVAARDRETVDRARLHEREFEELHANAYGPVCAFVFTPVPSGAYSRMFAPGHGVAEDPATGSATGPLAQFMMRHGLAPNAGGSRLVSEQGVKMGRRSLLHVRVRGENGCEGIDVGGHVVPLVRATMTLP